MTATGVSPFDAGRISTLERFRAAVALDLAELAALHDAEPDADRLAALCELRFPTSLRLRLKSDPGQQGTELMLTALDSLPKHIDQQVLDELAADYAAIYLTLAVRASPNESVWIDEEQLERQQPMFQVRKYYRRHGLAAANWRKRADDHLVLQLQFLSFLFTPRSANDHADLSEAARFLDEHLLRWLPQFAVRVAARCATPFFAGLALITAGYCEELRDLLVDILGQPRPSQEEINQRMTPKPTVQEMPLRYVPGIGPSV